MSDEIDDIWHYWILETMEYKCLCKRLTGCQFIHHRSNDYYTGTPKKEGLKNPIEWQVAMLSAYVTNYGQFKSDRVKYWRLADHLVAKHGWTVDELNSWLNSES